MVRENDLSCKRTRKYLIQCSIYFNGIVQRHRWKRRHESEIRKKCRSDAIQFETVHILSQIEAARTKQTNNLREYRKEMYSTPIPTGPAGRRIVFRPILGGLRCWNYVSTSLAQKAAVSSRIDHDHKNHIIDTGAADVIVLVCYRDRTEARWRAGTRPCNCTPELFLFPPSPSKS